MDRRQFLISLTTGTAGLALAPGQASAQNFPQQDIVVIVGYSPGSGPDIIARHFAAILRRKSGRNVIVENRVGALTNIAAQRVATAKPDGHTIFITPGNSTWAINSAIFKELPFRPLSDFAPITSLITTPFVFVVKEGSSIGSVKELTAHLRARDGKAMFGFPNSISLACAELYLKNAGLKATRVAYKSMMDAHQALDRDEIDFFVSDLTFRKGRMLALTTQERSPVAAEVPSAAEAGLPEFDLFSWFGAWAPAATPPAIIETIRGWLDEGVREDETRERFAKLGMAPWSGVSGDKLRDFTEAEMKKWKKIAEIADIPPP